MKFNIKAPSFLFCLIGISRPDFPKDKSFSTVFLFALSCFKCLLNIFLIAGFISDVKIEAQSNKVQLLLQINFTILCFCTFSCFFLSLSNFSREKLFWNTIAKVEAALKLEIDRSKGYNLFLVKCFAKIFFPYFGSTWLILISIFIFRNQESASISSEFFFPMFYSNMFILKFIYFCDVFWFYIENSLKQLRLDKDVVNAKKAFNCFWQLNNQLAHMFGLGITAAVVSQYLGIIMCLYHLVLKADNEGEVEAGAAYTLFFITFVVRRMAFSAQRCIDSARQFSTMSRSVDSSKEMESFYLQLRHQNLKFAAVSLLEVTNGHVTRVSIFVKNLCYETLCKSQSIFRRWYAPFFGTCLLFYNSTMCMESTFILNQLFK